MYGEVISGKTLDSLKHQAGVLNKGDVLGVEINSHGGSVSEGLAIVMWFKELSMRGVDIFTIVVGNAYSIASLIAISANARAISEHGDIMVHNPMLSELSYVNANELESYAKYLRKIEKALHNLYYAFTGVDEKTIKLFMNKETYLNPSECVEFGFSDFTIEMDKIEYSKPINNKNNVDMGSFKNQLLKAVATVKCEDVVSQFYYDSKGNEIEIIQSSQSTYSVGDKTSVEKGVVKLGSDGTELNIVNYEIENINKNVDVGDDGEGDADGDEGKKAPKKEGEGNPKKEPKKEGEGDDEKDKDKDKGKDKGVDMTAVNSAIDTAFATFSEKLDEKLSAIEAKMALNNKDGNEFKELTAKAIDAIASATSSTFTPKSPKVTDASEEQGSTLWRQIQNAQNKE